MMPSTLEHWLNIIGVIPLTKGNTPVVWPKEKPKLISEPIAKPGDF